MPPPRVMVKDARRAIGWVASLLKRPDEHPRLVEANAEMVSAQDLVAKAIDAAITARQEATFHSDALEAAWAEHAVSLCHVAVCHVAWPGHVALALHAFACMCN